MIVLDTNVVSELMKPEPDRQVQAWLSRREGDLLCLNAVAVSEIVFGLERLPPGRRRSDLRAQFDAFAEALTVLPMDEAAAREAGHFRALREQAGLAAQPSDMMIAGIASVAGADLATRNVRDFEALPISVLNPWTGA
mgnify:FL=1